MVGKILGGVDVDVRFGAWHGGWCWSKVKQALEAASGAVHTPTLTGLGKGVHLASREICLEADIEDVVRLIDYELLTDVILVGHSYAGVVVTAVADRVSQRLETARAAARNERNCRLLCGRCDTA